MYINVTTSHDMDFDDIQNNAWGNATNTIEEVQNHEKENDLMELLDIVYPDGVDEVEQIKKELRKGHDTITIDRFVVHYCDGMR